jgi:hypothetical protein
MRAASSASVAFRSTAGRQPPATDLIANRQKELN